MTDYYKQEIYIPHVDQHDHIIDRVERWKAHQEGILHRAITVALMYEGSYVLQHRRHPVFDGWFDLTASSHPTHYDDNTIESTEDCVYRTLEREWHISAEQVRGLHSPGRVVYKSPDPASIYIEHEVCHLYIATIDTLPVVDHEVAYGYTLQTADQLKSEVSPIRPALAAWVQEFIRHELI